MKETNEQLNQLLETFVSPSQGRAMAEDLRRGDRLFDRYPAPHPQAVDALRRHIDRHLKRKRRIHVIGHWAAAAAVAAILLAALWTEQPEQTSPRRRTSPPIASVGEWRLHHDLHQMDRSLEAMEDELSNLAETLETLDTPLYEPVNPLRSEVTELEELEAVTMHSEFWKG